MTKQVLLFGAFAAAVLLSMWWLSGIVPVIALNWRLGETPSSGLGRPFLFWLGLLAIALVRDYVVRRRDRNAVRPFAAALEPEIPADKASVMQSSAGLVDYTTTLGSLGNRTVKVTLHEVAGTRTGPIFRVEVSCECPWVLDMRRRSTFSRLLGWAGSVVTTGDPELDAAFVVQADDEIAVRHWLSGPGVRNNILALFRHHAVASVSLNGVGSGRLLRCELATNNPSLPPTRDAAGITAALCALAESAESCATRA